ncbi:YhdP family protein [Noviherbaspirillum galbum]|uniref:TIGR02099 family protein n=1 Tax=Noviherbaspirillum galbum TaxID=2709383 RepID=A0A6B3SMP5_9BURK|nr:YhdP family protein [Noviherbaspirillum galbum]NEX62003.1 TIGR02099 family protein [Noviherbaspirillum galbum]
MTPEQTPDQTGQTPEVGKCASRRSAWSVCWQGICSGCRTANTVTHHTLAFIFRTLVVVYFIFCALILGLRYIVLPNIDGYKPQIERLATRALGNRVSIAGIDASWDGLNPRLALHQVVIHDAAGNAALSLPDVSASLSWWTVAAGDLRLHELRIDGPDVEVRRDAGGKLYVGGIALDAGKRGDGSGPDWVLSQREIVVRNGRIRWNDAQRGAPELVLDHVDFLLRNRWQHHRFAIRATPPEATGAPIDVRAAFDHPVFARRISDPSRWKGQLYLNVPDADLTVWKAYVDYPVDMQQGKGAVRAWVDVDNARVANFTADLGLSGVIAQFGKDLPIMNLAEVRGRVSMQEELRPGVEDGKPTFGANGHAIALTDFTLRSDDGLVLPPTTISERFTPARNGKPEKFEVTAKLLDLHTLAELTERLPLPAEQRQLLADFEPHGILRDFSAQWQGAYPRISSYVVKGEFAGLGLKPQPARPAQAKTATTPAQAAVPAIPGIENLTGRVDANDRGGSFSLASEQLKLRLPGYFSEPDVPLDRLAMQAGWAFQDNNRLLLDVQKMEFAQDQLHGSLTGKHLLSLDESPGKPHGQIDLNGRFNGLEIAKVGRYLPLQTPQGLRDWLTGALVGGTANDVKLRIKGDLAQFPFQAGKGGKPGSRGEFSVNAKIANGALNYAPGHAGKDGSAPLWPLLENINGSISFEHARMEVHAASARTSGVDLANVKAVIPDLGAHERELQIDGEAQGPLQEFIRFTNTSPVEDWIGQFTSETEATGNARLGLKLQMPLARLPDTKVKGTLQFNGNTVALSKIIPPLSNATGKLEFYERGFTLGGVRASFLGGPVTLSGGTQRDGNIVVKGEGNLTADGVRKVYATPMTQRSSERITGGARYATTIRVRNHRPEIVVESNLAGLGLDFPVPLRKTASESLPLRFEMTGLPSNDPALLRDELKLSLGSAISARYERQKGADKEAEWRVVRGGIGVNVPAPIPDSGVSANVSLRSLDIDAWRRAASSIVTTQSQASSPAGTGKEANDQLSIMQYIDPDILAARATELTIMDKKLDNVVVGASHQKGVWQANIDSDQASGYVTWNEAPAGQPGLGRVTARLSSLIIPKSAASDVGDLLEGKNATTQIPALDIVAENFELFGKKFGHVELLANNVRGPAGREWRINKLAMVNADAELNGTGKWISRDSDSVSSLNYTLNIIDAGRLLDRLGFPNVLRGGNGKMEGEISWKGLPFSLDIPSLSGQVKLDMASGQFLKVDPGAAKLLGVLSLQSLPRRLALDFRDVFSEGFAFDGITANAAIAQGVARTDNFKMRGSAATVLIDGNADIAKEAQNLHVVVIPELNVGAASVVYGLAVNPVIGVGTFLAQLFLRDPLMKAFTFEYQITGPFKDPVVTKLLRRQARGADNTSNAGPNS